MRERAIVVAFLIGAMGAACAPSAPPEAAPPDAAGYVRAPGAAVEAWSPPPVAIDPLDFGVVEAVGGAHATAAIANTSGAPLEVGAIMTTGPFAVEGSTCGGTLAPEASCEVTIAFAPGVVGAARGTLAVAPAGAVVSAPLVGVGARLVRVRVVGGGAVTWTTGTGAGAGADDGGGAPVACGAACATLVTGPTELVSAPADGRAFLGWSGACAGLDGCWLAAQATPADVVATFTP